MEYLITAYPSTPTPAMILTPPARAYSPSPPPEPAPEPVASTSQLQLSTSRRVLDHVLLPRLPAGWLSAPPAGRVSEPVQDDKACHQCRNTKNNQHPRFRCGRAGCLRVYCTSCLSRRYAWSPADIHDAGCPGCRGVCNCSLCLDRDGLGEHKAFLTADARAGGCARKWLAERGLLVERDGPPPPVAQRKKNMVRRPRILARPKKTRPVEEEEEEQETRGRGRWIIDASAKLIRRWARERAARGAQVRAGTRRWFVGASPPPRARARENAPVETIDLTLDDDEDDAPDSLFDAKSADGDAQPAGDDKAEDAGEKIADEERARDSPDSLFDEKTEDGAAHAAPDDKSDADSLFDGDPGTSTPVQQPITPLLPAPTPIQLPPAPDQLSSTPIPIQLPPKPTQRPPTPIQLPPTPIQLPPLSPIVPTHDSLSRSDSYTDALRIDVELAVVGPASSPAKPAVDVQVVFGDPFAATSAARSPIAAEPARSPVAARSPIAAEPASLVAARSPAAPASPPKTFSKAASAMFIPRAKPVTKRKRDEDETRLDEARSSAGVLVALGRPGRAKRPREDGQREDVRAQEEAEGALVRSQADNARDAPVSQDAVRAAHKDDAAKTVLRDDAPKTLQRDDALLRTVDGAVRSGDAPAQKRPREDDAPALDDERPVKRAALSKETARKSRAGEVDTGTGGVPYNASPKHGNDYEPIEGAATARKPPRAASSRHEDANVVDGLPTPKPTATQQSAADALAQAMRAAYGGGATASAPVASSSNAGNTKRSKPSVLAQAVAARAGTSLAIALKTPAVPGPSMATALAAAYKQAYTARPASPASTLRSSPSPEPPAPAPALEEDEHGPDGKTSSSPTTTARASIIVGKPAAGKPALNDELSDFIGGFDDDADKDDEEPTPELLPSDLAAQSEGSSRTGPVSPVVAHRRPPALTSDTDGEEEMPARRPFVPCNPRRFVGMPLRFVPAKKRPRPRQAVKRVERTVIDLDSDDDDDYKDDDDEDEQDFGLARRRKRTKLWEQSVVLQQAHEPIVVLDDSDDSDFQPPGAPAVSKGKGKARAFGPGKGKTKPPPPRKLPLSSFIAYSYTPPATEPDPDPEPEMMPEPVFVPDDDTAAAPPASEVWLGAAMAPLSPDLGLTRAVADAWFGSVV